MKKISILILLCVLSISFIGCDLSNTITNTTNNTTTINTLITTETDESLITNDDVSTTHITTTESTISTTQTSTFSQEGLTLVSEVEITEMQLDIVVYIGYKTIDGIKSCVAIFESSAGQREVVLARGDDCEYLGVMVEFDQIIDDFDYKYITFSTTSYYEPSNESFLPGYYKKIKRVRLDDDQLPMDFTRYEIDWVECFVLESYNEDYYIHSESDDLYSISYAIGELKVRGRMDRLYTSSFFSSQGTPFGDTFYIYDLSEGITGIVPWVTDTGDFNGFLLIGYDTVYEELLVRFRNVIDPDSLGGETHFESFSAITYADFISYFGDTLFSHKVELVDGEYVLITYPREQ